MKESWLSLTRWFTPNDGETPGARRRDQPTFLSLDYETLCEELNIDAEAKENGVANIPSTAQTQFDATELFIAADIKYRIAQYKNAAEREIADLGKAIEARQLAPHILDCTNLPNEFRQALRQRTKEISNSIRDSQQKLKTTTEGSKKYRELYGITRAARLREKEDQSRALYLLMCFGLVQLVANAFLFAAGSTYGLAFGLTIALMVAFFDILLHFNLGIQAAKCEVREHKTLRAFGVFALIVGMVTIAFLNLGTVHLRLAGGDVIQWANSIQGNTLGFMDDFLASVLGSVGIFCSCLAMKTGWAWDEPIPRLLRDQREIDRFSQDIDKLKQDKTELESELGKEYSKKLDAIVLEAANHISLVNGHLSRVTQRRTEFEDYITEASVVFELLVTRYRQQNQKVRTATPPEFFRQPRELGELNRELNIAHDFTGLASLARDQYATLQNLLPEARKELMVDIGGDVQRSEAHDDGEGSS